MLSFLEIAFQDLKRRQTERTPKEWWGFVNFERLGVRTRLLQTPNFAHTNRITESLLGVQPEGVATVSGGLVQSQRLPRISEHNLRRVPALILLEPYPEEAPLRQINFLANV